MALNLPGKDCRIKWDSTSYETRVKKVSTIYNVLTCFRWYIGMQLPEKYVENFDVSNKALRLELLATIGKIT